MKRKTLIAVVAFVFSLSGFALADTDDAQPDQTSTASPSVKKSDGPREGDRVQREYKEKERGERGRDGKWELEYEARLEIERRERLERFRRGQHYHNDPFACETVVVVAPTVPDVYPERDYSYDHRGKQDDKGWSSAGVVFAPAQRGKSSALGIQWMGPRRLGAALWFSGSLYRGDDVLDGEIPHDDFYLEDKKGTYGMQGTAGFGSDDAMLVVGAGLTVLQTLYTAVSNVTGWKWDAGSDSELELSAQVGMRFRVAERFSLHFGYDTAQYGFFGISGTF